MNVIEVRNLKKHFGKVKAVDGIDFTVEKGEIFGFLGPNGAGKTTTIRCMMDFLRPDGGEIKILGMDAQKNSVKLKEDMGYVSGNVYLYKNWTGQMHIDYVSKLDGSTDIADKLIKRFDFDPSKKAKALSSGNRQKLGLILSLMGEPKLYIFDEPTNALDPILQHEVYEIFNEVTNEGATIFMSSHNMAEVERICDRVGVIRKGKMIATESIPELKDKKIYTVRAYFIGEFDKKELIDKDITLVKESKNNIVLRVKGDIDRMIKRLSKFQLRDLEIDQASLEDIFLEYYD